MDETKTIKKSKRILIEIKDIFLFIFTVIDLIFITINIIYSFNLQVEEFLTIYDLFVCILLGLDMLLNYYTSNISLKEFLKKDHNIINIITIIPFDFILGQYFFAIRYLRILRFTRILRIWHIKREIYTIEQIIQENLLKAVFIIFSIFVGVSAILLRVFDASFDSILNAIWFIIVTASTVGYGDMTPTTHFGKILTMTIILMGIIATAIFTAYLSAVYNRRSDENRIREIEDYISNVEGKNKTLKKEVIHLNRKLNMMEDDVETIKNTLIKVDEKLDKLLENEKE
ncbi:potassium channel family protein [Methanosphaera sp.]